MRERIVQMLQKYAKEHSAEYYLLLVTPEPDGIGHSGFVRRKNILVSHAGELGVIVQGVVAKEVLSKPV
jgi:hypothetical protein